MEYYAKLDWAPKSAIHVFGVYILVSAECLYSLSETCP